MSIASKASRVATAGAIALASPFIIAFGAAAGAVVGVAGLTAVSILGIPQGVIENEPQAVLAGVGGLALEAAFVTAAAYAAPHFGMAKESCVWGVIVGPALGGAAAGAGWGIGRAGEMIRDQFKNDASAPQPASP